MDRSKHKPCLGLNRSLPKVVDLEIPSANWYASKGEVDCELAHLNDKPYCATDSKPFFHTNVTSQALVAESLHDKKAETEFPPTATTLVSDCWSSIMLW